MTFYVKMFTKNWKNLNDIRDVRWGGFIVCGFSLSIYFEEVYFHLNILYQNHYRVHREYISNKTRKRNFLFSKSQEKMIFETYISETDKIIQCKSKKSFICRLS